MASGQQNFALSDPRLPDNPGVYELTGYALRGAWTDRKGVDAIRTAVENGTDATACLLNYKADGTPFWNQLFAAALRDANNCTVNYVSCTLDVFACDFS